MLIKIDFANNLQWKSIIIGFHNSEKDCNHPCGGTDELNGQCAWCGDQGYCCRKGYTGNGCDGQMGWDKHHSCVGTKGIFFYQGGRSRYMTAIYERYEGWSLFKI